jgi:hypothetical protein
LDLRTQFRRHWIYPLSIILLESLGERWCKIYG